MLPFVTGTVRDSVKLAAMDNKWQQRKSEITKSIKEKYGDSEKAGKAIQYLHYQVELEQIRESNHQAEIDAKIRSGAPLTPEELEYLKKKNPKAYQAYEEAKKEEKAYEKQLESCDTKEDVEKLENIKMGEFMAQLKEVANNPEIPDAEKLAQIEKIHAKAKKVQKVHDKFVKSAAYLSLPTEEERKKRQENRVERSDRSKDDQTQNGTEGRPEESTYLEVADAAKEFMIEHRETGMGLDMISEIEGELEPEREKDSSDEKI